MSPTAVVSSTFVVVSGSTTTSPVAVATSIVVITSNSSSPEKSSVEYSLPKSQMLLVQSQLCSYMPYILLGVKYSVEGMNIVQCRNLQKVALTFDYLL